MYKITQNMTKTVQYVILSIMVREQKLLDSNNIYKANAAYKTTFNPWFNLNAYTCIMKNPSLGSLEMSNNYIYYKPEYPLANV